MTKIKINISYYKNQYCDMVLGSYKEKLCILNYYKTPKNNQVNKRVLNFLNAEFVERNDPTLDMTKLQLDQYFNNQRKSFKIPLLFIGTDFQKQVWNTLLSIKYNKPISYKELANKIHKPKAIRAVANANGANPLSIIVPCHRVIASDGSIGGYAGGVDMKKTLLELEQNYI